MPLFTFAFGVEPVVGWTFVWIFTLLGAVTGALPLVRRSKPTIDYDDLMSRAKGWWVVMLALFAAFLVGPAGTWLLFGWLSMVGLLEILALSPAPVGRPLRGLCLLAIAVQYALVAAGAGTPTLVVLPLVAVLAVPIVAMLAEPPEGFAARVGTTQLALVLAGFGLSQIPAMLALPGAAHGAGGRGLIVYVLLLTQFNDIAQYYWGKAAGRTLLVPRLSPKKTWAGLLGGMVTMAAMGWWLAPVFTPIPQAFGPIVGAGVALAGLFGDLTISALKREAGVKDTGTLLPGFGGVMDRLDSLVYAAPLVAVAVRWWGS